MTPEIEKMSAAVAQFFGWWKPGKCTVANVHCRHLDEPWFNSEEDFKVKRWAEHEIPPPDLTQPEWFVRVLKTTQFSVGFNSKKWWSSDGYHRWMAETPELALLKAAYQLIKSSS